MTTATIPFNGTYVADPVHSSFGFAVRYMGVSTFRGTLSDARATLTGGDHGIALEGAARVESISIQNPPEFRQHVLSAEFFDAENHPEVTFRSSDVRLEEDGTARVRGELTIRGVTQPVEATGTWQPPAEDAFGRTKGALSLTAEVDRTAFGMNWNVPTPKGGKALDERVTLSIDLLLAAHDAE